MYAKWVGGWVPQLSTVQVVDEDERGGGGHDEEMIAGHKMASVKCHTQTQDMAITGTHIYTYTYTQRRPMRVDAGENFNDTQTHTREGFHIEV